MRSFFLAILMAFVAMGVCGCGKSLDEQQMKILDVQWSSVGSTVRLIGKTGKPIGTVCVLTGVVVEGPYKGYEDGPNLVVDSVDGVEVADPNTIRVIPLTYWLNGARRTEKDVEPVVGNRYRILGYETASYVGIPNEVFQRTKLVRQTTDHHLRTDFVVIELEPLNAPDLPAQKK